jgi:hypothetical protein
MKLTRTTLIAASFATAVAVAVGGGATAAMAAGTNTVVIDASKDVTAANTAMALFPAATDKSFTTVGSPSYSQTGWELASTSTLNNPPTSKEDLTKEYTATHTETSSWSLGGSVSSSAGLSALGFANAEVSVKFTANHEWATENTDSEQVTVTAKPGKVVWVVASHTQVSFTGDYTFTADGTQYEVRNLTITEPAADPATGGDTHSSTTYMAVERDYGTVHPTATSTGQPSGSLRLAQTPVVAKLTAQLPPLAVGH